MARICTVAIFISCALVCMLASASASIIEIREYHGRQIACARSGLLSVGTACGTEGNYAYVFVGSVLSVTNLHGDEKRLQITPQEIFLGDPATQLTVTTEQGACLPEIAAGEQWLFYLRRDDKSKGLLLGYGSPSAPIADAEPIIAILRRLAAMTDTGLIRGNLFRYVENTAPDGSKSDIRLPMTDHKVILKRDSDGVEYSALSDKNGDYEFEPLSAGSYHINANTVPGLWTETHSTTVRPRSCTDYRLQFHSDGTISGHVKSADGKPFPIQPWIEITREDHSFSQSSPANDHGHFEFKGLEPGRYLVGLHILAEPNSPDWQSRIYYPGVRTEEEATVIELGKSEKRRDVDFQLLPAVLP